MIRKSIDVFINEIYSKPPKKHRSLLKQMFNILITFGVYTYLYSKDFGIESNRGHRNVLVGIDKFSRIGWRVP